MLPAAAAPPASPGSPQTMGSVDPFSLFPATGGMTDVGFQPPSSTTNALNTGATLNGSNGPLIGAGDPSSNFGGMGGGLGAGQWNGNPGTDGGPFRRVRQMQPGGGSAGIGGATPGGATPAQPSGFDGSPMQPFPNGVNGQSVQPMPFGGPRAY